MMLAPGKPQPTPGTRPLEVTPQRYPQDQGQPIYLAMSTAIAAIVVFGFSRTIDRALLHPASPRPPILFIHVALSIAWVLLLIVQTCFIRAKKVRWHRRLGIAGALVGIALPCAGIATAIVMTRFHAAEGGADGAAFLVVPFFDMLAFAVTFGWALRLRHWPQYHRRLMLLASCGLTVAAFARFPAWLMPDHCWYIAVDLLILFAIGWEWAVTGHVHPVYRYAIPILLAGQAMTMWVYLSSWGVWLSIAHAVLD